MKSVRVKVVAGSAFWLLSGCSSIQTKETSAPWPVPGPVTFTQTGYPARSTTFEFLPNGGVACAKKSVYDSCDFPSTSDGPLYRWRVNGDKQLVLSNQYRSFTSDYPENNNSSEFKVGFGDGDVCIVPPSVAIKISFKGRFDSYETYFMSTSPDGLSKFCDNDARKQLADKKREMIKRFGKKFGPVIAEKKVMIGMTKEMAMAALGEPSNINRTVTASYVSEQWVYDGIYLYFSGNTLRSFQD